MTVLVIESSSIPKNLAISEVMITPYLTSESRRHTQTFSVYWSHGGLFHEECSTRGRLECGVLTFAKQTSSTYRGFRHCFNVSTWVFSGLSFCTQSWVLPLAGPTYV